MVLMMDEQGISVNVSVVGQLLPPESYSVMVIRFLVGALLDPEVKKR